MLDLIARLELELLEVTGPLLRVAILALFKMTEGCFEDKTPCKEELFYTFPLIFNGRIHLSKTCKNNRCFHLFGYSLLSVFPPQGDYGRRDLFAGRLFLAGVIATRVAVFVGLVDVGHGRAEFLGRRWCGLFNSFLGHAAA